MVGSAVETIVWSSDASSITSIRAPRTSPSRPERGGAVSAIASDLHVVDAAPLLQAILDAAFDSIITMDSEGRVVEVNHAAEEMFGYTAEEMVGRELAELIIPPHLREPHRRGVERYVATGQGRMVGHPVELPAMRSDGSEFPVEIAISRPNLPGPPLFTGFLRDVTERQRNELALRTLGRRAGRAAAGGHRRRARGRPRARVRGGDRGARPPARRADLEHDPLRARRRRGRGRRLEHRRRAQRAGRHARGARRPDRGGVHPRQRAAGARGRLLRDAGLDRRPAARAGPALERRHPDLARRAAVGRGARLNRRGDARSPKGPSSGSPTSPSSSAWRSPTPRRARSWPTRAPASCGGRRGAAADGAQPARRRAAAPRGALAGAAAGRAQARRAATRRRAS